MKRADALRVEGRRRRGRPGLRWKDCTKRDVVGVGGEWRTRARDGGVETVGGDDSEMGLVTKKTGKKKLTTGIGASLTRTTGIKRRTTNNITTIVLFFLCLCVIDVCC